MGMIDTAADELFSALAGKGLNSGAEKQTPGTLDVINKLLRTTLLASVLWLLLLAAALAEGPWYAARQNTYGWQFMTPDERVEQQRTMRRFTSYDDCKTYQNAHHAEMAARAHRAGTELAPPREAACDKLRARGRLQ